MDGLNVASPHRGNTRKRKDNPNSIDEVMTVDLAFNTPSKRAKWKLSQRGIHSEPSPLNSPGGSCADITPVSLATPLHSESQIQDLMQTLDKEQLVSLVVSLVTRHPGIKDAVAALIPRPSLDSVTNALLAAEKRLSEAFPYSKLGPDRSDYAYNRVKPHIEELQAMLTHYMDFFTLPRAFPSHLQHEYPALAFGYLHVATSVVHRLPIWQNEERNSETRSSILERLGRHWCLVVAEVGRRARDEGKVFGSTTVGEWARNLHLHTVELKGAYGFTEAFIDFRRQLGWIIGLDPVYESPAGSSDNRFLPIDMASGHSPGLFSPF